MANPPLQDEEVVSIDDTANEVGGVVDISPSDKARLTMAYLVLAGVAILLVLSWASLMFIPDNRQVQAQAFFDFVRAFGPPLITLVLGYYFRDSQS
ncbi:hypothetical protein ABB26_03625 [Stenotrophomonas humi]|uniref:Transmembrane protein n=1 Tax=Stenotrophomonas humi TaxID=405444 RepID=A0A0R0CHE5_9GAMM|nr:hypothetical protein [Stenotrophomonas humi]KRG65642.1 hypothetical protein ABB26_03625 [Stenotrophomonas humi]